MTPDLRAALREQLIAEEGLRLRVYTDSRGVPTLGVGRNIRDKGITTDEALLLLDHDLDECDADLSTFGWFASLDAVRQRAVLDLRFNLGPYRFRGFVKMLDAIAQQDYARAAVELGTSAWARQVQPSRVTRLVQQVRTGA